MPGIGDKPFLLLIVFRHRPYDPLGKKEDQDKDRHKSKRCHPYADDQKSPEAGKYTPAIQKHDLHFIRVIRDQIAVISYKSLCLSGL